MILFSLKFFIYEPKCLLLMSFSYKVLELLKKHQAAKSKSGVVGNIGTKIPITPNVNDNKPNIVNKIFIIILNKSDVSMCVFYGNIDASLHSVPQFQRTR